MSPPGMTIYFFRREFDKPRERFYMLMAWVFYAAFHPAVTDLPAGRQA
jgi:hypothetical protein